MDDGIRSRSENASLVEHRQSDTTGHKTLSTNQKTPAPAVVCDALVSLLLEAQEAMENLPMGGIGRDGATQAEIDEAEEAGHAIEDDASHHQGQKAWLILERAKALLANTSDQPPARG